MRGVGEGWLPLLFLFWGVTEPPGTTCGGPPEVDIMPSPPPPPPPPPLFPTPDAEESPEATAAKLPALGWPYTHK